MADDTVVIESKADAATQQKALAIGWIPPERFKGDAERFVDADDYIKRGEDLLPIVKANNRHLQDQVQRQHGEITELRTAVAASQKAIEEMELRHSAETQKKVEQARVEVKTQLAKASADGDHEGVAELTDQLTQLNTAEREAKEQPPKKETPPAKFEPSPAMLAFTAEHTWFGKDQRKTNYMMVEVADLRATSEGRGMSEADLYSTAAETVLTMLGEKKAAAVEDKVEGARGSGGSGGGKGGKGYSGLPSDAKAACDADLSHFVGKGKKFSDAAAYRAHWASIYNAEG